jgi:preprotein translocase subunit SecG
MGYTYFLKGLNMRRTARIAFFFFIVAIVLGLFIYAPASAQDTDLSVSPSKGPADAPVEIGVFSCFG